MKILKAIFVAVLILSTMQCKKDKALAPVNITLYDKSLPIIQSYVVGKWKLQYEHGGFVGNAFIPVRNNPFLYLTKDSIIIGDNAVGVTINTKIDWLDSKTLGYSYSEYLISYTVTSSIDPYPVFLLINKIHNDTLLLQDFGSDPLSYEYTKIQ